MKIGLEFTPAQSPKHQSRLRYAFQLFCAIYGHEPVVDLTNTASADLWITYSSRPPLRQRAKILRLYDGYRLRPLTSPAPRPRPFSAEGRTTVLFHPGAIPTEVDWLAEIFEWVSCADEYSVVARDSIGRIPFEHSVFSRYGLDERRPYAALAMWFLQRAICRLFPGMEDKAKSPQIGFMHAIVCSHDIDFIPLGYFSTLSRLAKNSLISLRQSPTLAFVIAARAARFAFGGTNPLQNIEQLARSEKLSGVTSSFNFIVRHGHRRDGNYRIESKTVTALAKWLQSMGMEIGVHGSYTSLETDEALASEFEILNKRGFRPLGGRQHWLRFSSLDRLIAALERAGALVDTTVGWPSHIGFRAGACFPFPPYNFIEERPARFLEFPLVVMDQALPSNKEEAFSEVARLFTTSRTYGWGGISLLWHPAAFRGGQLPIGIGRTFYNLMNARLDWKDTWLSAESFLRHIRNRYIEAGLFDRTWGAHLINVDGITENSVQGLGGRILHAALP